MWTIQIYKQTKKEIIKNGGFSFGDDAKLKQIKTDGRLNNLIKLFFCNLFDHFFIFLIYSNKQESNLKLNENQEAFLNKYDIKVDPLIPVKPKLVNLFDFGAGKMSVLYKYPTDFNHNSFKFTKHLFEINPDFQEIINGIISFWKLVN